MSRLPSLDGVRAVAVLLVIGTHAEANEGFPAALKNAWHYCFNGGLGVAIFFVLSGFLITHLLLVEEAKNKKVSLVNFYVRRVLRILPVYFAFLLVLMVLTRVTQVRLTPGEWLVDLTFTRDFLFDQPSDAHLWSLAVEEQFYLLWPLLFCCFDDRGRLLAATLFIGLAPVFRVAFYALGLGHFVQFSFFSNMDALMFGCATALLIKRNGSAAIAHLTVHSFKYRLGACIGIYSVWLLQRHYVLGKLVVPFGPTLENICIAILLVSVTYIHKGILFRFLNLRVMTQIGILSYSLYIWQEFFVMEKGYYSSRSHLWLEFPYAFIPIFVVAAGSYYFLETPFMHLRRFFRETPSRTGLPA